MAQAVTVPNLLLSTVATAFLALTQCPEMEEIDRLVRQLIFFLKLWRGIVTQQASASRRKRSDELPLFVLPKAIYSITNSLLQLARDKSISPTKESRLAELIRFLRELCVHQDGQLYLRALEHLSELEKILRRASETDLTGLLWAEQRETAASEDRPARTAASAFTGWQRPRALSPSGTRERRPRVSFSTCPHNLCSF